MLILTRRIGEKIIIGEGKEAIEIYVSDIHGGQVRIGVDAPAHIQVHREEIYQRIQAENAGKKRLASVG